MQRTFDVIGKFLFCLLVFSIPFTAFGQTKKRKPPVKETTIPAVASVAEPITSVPLIVPPKKNERPGAAADSESQDKSNSRSDLQVGKGKVATPVPSYFYEFTQPDFPVSSIVIEHDESGNGTLAFVKNRREGPISDPIRITPAALERINKALSSLNFFDSNESYQYEKDYSHLGSIKFRLRKDGRERGTAFNWTVNKDARALADEYRKIANQFIWMFDISVARENQPLEAPKLLNSLESLIRRNEISDSQQIAVFLKTLTDDERLPLIARNHAVKIVKKIEKESK